MRHFHIIVHEPSRNQGALCLTEDTARIERDFEVEMKHRAEIRACDDACFASSPLLQDRRP